MILKNLRYIDESFQVRTGDIETEDSYIKGLEPSDKDGISFEGLTALPGFIDIHTHGGSGADFCDKCEKSLEALSMHYAKHGVTSVCPTTMTLSFEELKEIFTAIENYKGKEKGAYFHGINMEGPYVSVKKCGAQNTDYIKAADFDEFMTLHGISEISLVDVAPETEGAYEFSEKAQKHTVCSVAHTNASYGEAKKAFERGFTHVTHFYNAMTPYTHREPGVVGAVLENDSCTAEMICDGFHLDKATVKITFKILGDDRIVCISDSLSSASCEDGEYMLGGQKVIVKNGKAHLENGTIAGSTSNLFEEFKNLLSWGIPFESALKACSVNPAKAIGVYDKCGSIEKGKNADLIFVDSEMNLKHVMVKGKMIF